MCRASVGRTIPAAAQEWSLQTVLRSVNILRMFNTVDSQVRYRSQES